LAAAERQKEQKQLEEEGWDAIDLACSAYENSLDEEIFFFMYHFQLEESQSMAMVPYKRKWMIQRFIDQKRKENEEVERAKRSAQAKVPKR
jgi:hypothetical protein